MNREYDTIEEFYRDRKAARSGVRLMNHIDEGLVILDEIGASENAKKAFCLHPIVQNNEDVDVTWSDALALAQEYRDKANAYLCRPSTDHLTTIEQISEVVGQMSQCCHDMLVADKKQNLKDFMIYHQDTHPRSECLFRYFHLWLRYLGSDLWKLS